VMRTSAVDGGGRLWLGIVCEKRSCLRVGDSIVVVVDGDGCSHVRVRQLASGEGESGRREP